MQLHDSRSMFRCRPYPYVISVAANVWDQRAAEVDIHLTNKRTTAAPLHPMVRPYCDAHCVTELVVIDVDNFWFRLGINDKRHHGNVVRVLPGCPGAIRQLTSKRKFYEHTLVLADVLINTCP